MDYIDELKRKIPEGVLQFCAVAVLNPQHELQSWFTLSPQDNVLDVLDVDELDEACFRFVGVFNAIDRSLREAVVCLVLVDLRPVPKTGALGSRPTPFGVANLDFHNLDKNLPFLAKGDPAPRPEIEYWRHCRKYLGQDLLFAPAAGALVLDDEGRILLQRRGDDGTWGILGGGSEVGESPMETALREVREETGLLVRLERLLSVATGDDCTLRYPNGDQGKFWGFLFSARIVGGTMIQENEETLELRWFDYQELETLENCSLYLKHNYANYRNPQPLIHAKKLREIPLV